MSVRVWMSGTTAGARLQSRTQGNMDLCQIQGKSVR